MKTEKVVKIKCSAGGQLLDIESLDDFQGDLKDLTDEAYEKLKSEISDQGYSFAIHVWKNKGRNHILDGHQRVRTIRHMCEYEGWSCPPLPVVYVEADSLKQAKAKLLAATSQYGDMTKQGLYEFIEDAGLKFPEVEQRFKFNDVNFTRFADEFYLDAPAEGDEIEKTKETKEVSFNKFACPKCGHEFYEGDKAEVKPKSILRKKAKPIGPGKLAKKARKQPSA